VEKSEFKILVAEDDAMVRDVIVKFLTDEGYSVIVANDGLAAIKSLRLEDIKLVLTDLRMPGADGMEVLRTALKINPKIAVVLVTAYGTLDTALEAMKEGAYDYIVKPFVMQQLLLVVRNAFNLANLIEENEELSKQLKETYRTLEALRGVGSGEDKIVQKDSKKTEIIDSEEAKSLKEKIISDDENLKKFNSLVNNLKKYK
jgi:DNA-binding NtrC family response regulator